MDWQAAKDFCITQYPGAFLAEPKTLGQMTYVQRWMAFQGGDREYWLGANDITTEGQFVWSRSGQRVDAGHTAWRPGQSHDHGKDCMKLTNAGTGTYSWSFDDCAGFQYPICQYRL